MNSTAAQPIRGAYFYLTKPQLYKSGVYTAKCGTNLDHGVLVVRICHCFRMISIEHIILYYMSAKLDLGRLPLLQVGYGTWTDGALYWKVKNSWSSQWGKEQNVRLC